ncbi:unnamed protein product [Pocillopora meandrina]|uniref:Uncharacterized protein n=1 Tax=Pocillopora meandrina TaxID=46732 RepID=A0AAU9X0I0_9CNID|nr:unnamed protein product [Pocillopora meandrina]
MINKNHPPYRKVESRLASGITYQPKSGPSKLCCRVFLVGKVNTKGGTKRVSFPNTKRPQLLLLQTIPRGTRSDATKGVVENGIKTGTVTDVDKDSTKRFSPWYKPKERNDRGEPLDDTLNDEDLIRSDGLNVAPSPKHVCAPAGKRHLVATDTVGQC